MDAYNKKIYTFEKEENEKPAEKIIITDKQIVNEIEEWLKDCDSDELARIAGEVFGGACYERECDDEENGNEYEFTPDENYFGAFDNE